MAPNFGPQSNDTLVQINKMFPISPMLKSLVPCDACLSAKHMRLPFPISITYSDKCFDLIYMDIRGPFCTPYMLDHHYSRTIVDDHIRLCWTFFMKQKFETSSLIKSFINGVKTQFQTCVKTLKSDNGPKFTLQRLLFKSGYHSSNHIYSHTLAGWICGKKAPTPLRGHSCSSFPISFTKFL